MPWRALKNKLTYAAKVALARGRMVPLVGQFVITHRCNADCSYCFGRFPHSRKPDLPAARFRDLVDELKSLGCLEVTLEGGEPLLRDDLGDLVEHVKRRGLIARITTNGLLAGERLDVLRNADVVVVSLDGDAAFNDRGKRIQGSDEIINNIILLKKQGRALRINTTLTGAGLWQLDFLEELCLAHDIPLKINVLMERDLPYSEEVRVADYGPFIARLRQMKRRIRLMTSDRMLDKFERWTQDGSRPFFVLDEKGSRAHKYCGKNVIMIDVDGQLYPCCVYRPRVANCFDTPILEAMRTLETANHCVDCVHFGFDDFNSTMALDPRMLLNSLRYYRLY